MEINISDDQRYLNDVEFWVHAAHSDAAGAITAVDAGDFAHITEMCQLIDSIEIYADSKKVCYIADARHLLSILIQRKKNSDGESQLSFK